MRLTAALPSLAAMPVIALVLALSACSADQAALHGTGGAAPDTPPGAGAGSGSAPGLPPSAGKSACEQAYAALQGAPSAVTALGPVERTVSGASGSC